MTLPRSDLTEVPSSLYREWLVTNGIGGFASGTVSQANTRRYHGLLVASLHPPVDRVLMVSKLDAVIRYLGQDHPISTNEFADGTVSPSGYSTIVQFSIRDRIPTWTYAIHDAVLEQRIWMANERNTTYVSWTLVHAREPVQVEITPLCTYRDYHAHSQGGWALDVKAVPSGCQITAFQGARPFRLLCEGAEFWSSPDWFWRFLHRAESQRGMDAVEDLFSPGRFTAQLAPGKTLTVIATAELDTPMPPSGALENERRRAGDLTKAVPPDAPNWIRELTYAADQFLVRRAPGEIRSAVPQPSATVIAGYPWFADWGRDTMIALPGLTLATGHSAQARSVLETFAQHVSQGMLPNRFPDGGERPEYNTVDATLWYFHAIAVYLSTSNDKSLLDDLYPTLKEIISWHVRGTRFSIHVDPADGLLYAGEVGCQLTWMDAKVGDRVITPRTGKAVEVNALWHFALRRMTEWAIAQNDNKASVGYAEAAMRVANAYAATFWYPEGGYLYDVVDGPQDTPNASGRRVDHSLRPNQLFAVSLGESLMSTGQARSVVDVCSQELLTPVGLRSLSPADPRYAKYYQGGPADRDAVYHQGTVWSWLLGPFALAHYRVYQDRAHANAILASIAPHLKDAALGSVSEIFDAEPPHQPRGCFAQAWSVGELLRAWYLLRSP